MLLNLLANQLPSDFWHDSFGQFVVNAVITVIIALGSAGVAIWIFRKQQAYRALTYRIISDAPLANVNKTVENRITLQLDGQPVQNARLLVIKVQNTGNTAIKRDDYEQPLAFVFSGRTIVGCDVLETEPVDLLSVIDKKNFVKLETDTAEMEKFLLNPKQAVTFTVFLTGTSSQPDVRGRLVDGEIVKYAEKHAGLKEIPDWIGWPLFLGILVAAALLAIEVVTIAFTAINQIFIAALLGVITFIGIVFALIWGTERLLAKYGFFLIR